MTASRKPVVSWTVPQAPLTDANGHITWAWIKWFQGIQQTINSAFDQQGNFDGNLGVDVSIVSRPVTLLTILQNIDDTGVVTAAGIDFARPYLNKDTDHINDGLGNPLAGGRVAYAAMVGSGPHAGQILVFDGSTWQPHAKATTIPKAAHEWLDSYNDATGTFTASQPSFIDLIGIANPTQIGTGTPLAGYYVDGATGAWTPLPASGITQLTGDVTAGPGTGSQAATLAASGVTAGTYTNATVQVDAKGRVLFASTGAAPTGSGLIQLIQFAAATGTTCSFAHNVQKGSTVIVEWVGNSTTPTFSDNQSNVYTVRNSITWATVTTTPSQAYALNVAAGALTVTASTTGVINIYEYSNVDSVEAYNGATYDGSTGLPGSGTLATGNVTTTIPQDVIHMTGMGNAGSGVTLTNAGSWPSIQTVANIPTAVTIESWYTTESVSGTFSNTLSYAGIPSGGSGHAYAAILALKPRAVQQSPGFTLTTTGTSGAATLTGATLNVPNYTGGGGGNYVLLESHSASNSASLDFTASISSTYNVYEIVFVNLVPATSGAAVSLRMSTNGGSSYDSGSNYSYSFGVWVPAGPGSGGSNATTQLQLAGTSNADAAYSASGTVRLYSPLSSSAYKNVVGTMFSIDTTADGRKSEVWTCGGSYLSTTAVNAIRVLFSSGNITSGTVRIYGIN